MVSVVGVDRGISERCQNDMHSEGDVPRDYDLEVVPLPDEMRLYNLLRSLGDTALRTFPIWRWLGHSQDDTFGEVDDMTADMWNLWLFSVRKDGYITESEFVALQCAE